jgi:DNA polymerase-3 subunit alpha
MPEFVPLHVHDHYSLLDGLSKPEQIAKRCHKLGYKACAITNHGSISGAVDFIKAMEKKTKEGQSIKWILGNEFYLADKSPSIKTKENRNKHHLCVLAKNKDGWKSLVKATSESNKPDNFYYRPRLDLDTLSKFTGNLIAFSGHPGSQLANVLFKNPKIGYNAKTTTEARMVLKDNWRDEAIAIAGKHQDIFGKGNFYIEIQLVDKTNLPSTIVIAECLREVSRITGIPCVATPDAHYPSRKDAADQRVLLVTALQTTLSSIHHKIEIEEEFGLGGFFKSNNYHIPSLDEMLDLHSGYEHEIQNAANIAEQCETYNLAGKPSLPHFDCPNGMNEAEYLRHLCREGWKYKIAPKIPKDQQQVYVDRIKKEMEVINGAGLPGYFLIVQDFIKYAKDQGWLVGPGRGSAAGCLISYLIGITSIDPIPYDLLFERFYNAGRNTATHISFPDIDSDFPISKRESVIEYVMNKYGKEYVSQIVTFGRMRGRGAIKDVFRAHEACSFDTMNRITEFIPDEARIADELQEMKDAGENPSIITWALRNNSDQLKEWCYLDKEGKCDGPMARLFEQAIRLEGTLRNMGKHAAGVVISTVPLAEVCPMVYDNHSKTVNAGMEYEGLEWFGIPKFDILGVASLDKIMGVISILEKGSIRGEKNAN